MWLAVCVIVGILWLLYYLWTDRFNYWKSRNFPYIEPSFPFGNLKDAVLLRRYQGHVHQELYYKAEPHPYAGVFSVRRPFLLVRDPEIIKHVLVKDFNHFRERINVPRDHPLTEHLFNLAGDKWRAMRVKLTPTFTSGKLKVMYQHFQTCAAELDNVLHRKAEGRETIDIKNLMFRFTCDIIGTCAFGLEMNTLNNEDTEFSKISMMISRRKPSLFMKFNLFLLSAFPNLQPILRSKFVSKYVTDFVIGIITETVDFREKNNIKRNDFLDLLIELKNKSNVDTDKTGPEGEGDKNYAPLEMTMERLAAQCFVFLVAGFETSSSVQSYCMYELAQNPHIQERLREEIDEAVGKHGGELSYQAIQDMSYLDQIISETMRKYPTLPFLNRTCTKRYKMPDSGLVVEEGIRLIIPVYALHHDPRYFPEPDNFDPDRFSPERKSSIAPFTYLPFGEGPRICIGMRFGLLQTKMGLSTILRKYKLSLAEKSAGPLKFRPSALASATEGPIMLKIEPRANKSF